MAPVQVRQAKPGSSLALPAGPTHLPRVPGAGWSWAGSETLSQLLCPVSGKPPAGELPVEPACLCTCPLGFQEADGEREALPQPCLPVSTAQTHRWRGVVQLASSPPLEPSQPEPVETLEGKLRHTQGPLAEGPSSQGWPPPQIRLGSEVCTENV